MHHVAEAGLEIPKGVGRAVGLFGIAGSLHGMDHQMVGEGVFRRKDKNGLDRANQFLRSRLRPTVGEPQVPGPQVGERFSEESPDDHSRLSHARTFVVDPIDGTRGFLEGREPLPPIRQRESNPEQPGEPVGRLSTRS